MATQYTLGHYGYASGQHSVTSGASQTVMDYGNNGVQQQMPDMYLGTAGVVTGATTIATLYGSETYYLSFTGVGTKFNDRIRSQSRNFAWSHNGGANFEISGTGYSISLTVLAEDVS